MRAPTLRACIPVATALVLVCCVTLVTFALVSAGQTQAGILTLRINVTQLLQPPSHPGQPAADARPDAAVSQTLTAVLPETISLGTTHVCFEVAARNRECHHWPLALAGVFPASVGPFWPPGLDGTDAPTVASASAPHLHIRTNLLEGLLAVLTQTFVVNGLLRDVARFPAVGFPGHRILWTAVLFVFGLRCCLPFYKTVIVLDGLRSTSQDLPAWITVQFGPVYGMCLVCLLGSATLAALGMILV
ncbi:hypothetical protein SEUCBS139899_004724 [Sporothrix eucalyptigena]